MQSPKRHVLTNDRKVYNVQNFDSCIVVVIISCLKQFRK
jgi:hypothetical protein